MGTFATSNFHNLLKIRAKSRKFFSLYLDQIYKTRIFIFECIYTCKTQYKAEFKIITKLGAEMVVMVQ